MDEQRLFLRKKVSLALPIELLPGKEVWLHDLGEGGLSVSGSSRLEPGTATFFKFQFPDASSVIEASGLVVWCDSSGRVGIRFTRIKPDSSAVLKRWLRSQPGSEESKTSSERAVAVALQPPRAHQDVAQLREAVSAARLEGRAALNLIVERMLLLTRASGAAIALREGDDVVCRATVGNAPDVGTRLNLEASVTGECYRTGNIVSISDSDNDPRVNPELCRRLEFRSLLVVPITIREEVIGVGEVFSPIPGNFEGGDILLLGSMAEIIAEIHRPEEDRWMIPAVKLAYDIPVLDQISPPESAEAQAPGEVIAAETSPANESVPGLETETSTGQAELQRSTDVATSDILEGRTDNHRRNGAAPDTNWKPHLYALLVAFFALLAVALGDFLDWHLSPHWVRAQLSANARPATPKPPVSVAQPVLEKVDSGAFQTMLPRAEDSSALKPTIATPMLLRKASAREGSLHPSLRRISADDVQVEEQVPAATAVASAKDGSAPAPATSGTSPSLDQVSALQLRPAKLLHRVEPIFPDFAKEAGLDGTILLSAIIGTDGRLKDMKLVSGNRALATEAFRALRDWRYRPYLLNGKPIEAETRIVMNFHR